MTTHAAPPRRWAPTTVYVLVAFLAGGVLVALQAVTGPDPDLLELVQFAPAIAVAAVLLVWRGRWRPPLAVSLWRPDPAILAAASGSVVIILALPAAVLVSLGAGPDFSAVRAGAAPLGLLVLAQCVGAYGEELGWRGFLQPYLRTRHSVLITGVLVGTVWGVWHVQVFAAGAAYAAAFLSATIAMSVLLAVLLDNGRQGSLLIATVFHAAVNLGLLAFGDAGGREPMLWSSMAVAAAGCAAATAALRSSRNPAGSAERGRQAAPRADAP
ncbi:membrane protease YdiL (CAAX protease family) [Rhodococcus sp. PvR044]|uniref:CPBP family intramembrane glutamic endopeptidase n=1 Tax=Rhodococcus TaxID=1827 RepID=UPI001AE46674|nr:MULTISPECIES: type II CAAX endopeptidase family protein [Rhodococcus]MBP1161416.1 membrane protease YdiL (CAAX protease family) [Rhodococcus sp. PvR099]MCZ4555940.1 type II CAAX endopeptidase family protein [Rhodococcus maanshanensis]